MAHGYACITSANPPIMQQVAVKVANRGYDSATVPVYLLVNKGILGPQTLTMAPYSTCEAVFEADMSQPSEQYILAAFTALEGDEDPSNDTVTKTVTCRGPANPYQMDFEYCADFAKGWFNPAWTSLDRDGKPVNGRESLGFPVMGQACGFIAFNPDQTEPSLLASGGDAEAEAESFVRTGQTREAPGEAWSMAEMAWRMPACPCTRTLPLKPSGSVRKAAGSGRSPSWTCPA